MADTLREVLRLNEIVATRIWRAVGGVGVRAEHLSEIESVRLSIGGLVFSVAAQDLAVDEAAQSMTGPKAKQPMKGVDHPELAVVNHYIQTAGSRSHGIPLARSGHYIFSQTEDGLTQGSFVPINRGFYHEETNLGVYDLRFAVPISTVSEANYVLEICQKFDVALALHRQAALNAYLENPPFPE